MYCPRLLFASVSTLSMLANSARSAAPSTALSRRSATVYRWVGAQALCLLQLLVVPGTKTSSMEGCTPARLQRGAALPRLLLLLGTL